MYTNLISIYTPTLVYKHTICIYSYIYDFSLIVNYKMLDRQISFKNMFKEKVVLCFYDPSDIDSNNKLISIFEKDEQRNPHRSVHASVCYNRVVGQQKMNSMLFFIDFISFCFVWTNSLLNFFVCMFQFLFLRVSCFLFVCTAFVFIFFKERE